jgi:hypothetical protein
MAPRNPQSSEIDLKIPSAFRRKNVFIMWTENVLHFKKKIILAAENAGIVSSFL